MKILGLLAVVFSFVFASVDINNASLKELVSLKGIGAKKAEAIIEYRKTHCFKDIDELVKVKGIGRSILEKNRENLKVGACEKK